MIPQWAGRLQAVINSPRIRGDDPGFSEWSGWHCSILPVFAGMIPKITTRGMVAWNSPRIRGDDPTGDKPATALQLFSPYSRG